MDSREIKILETRENILADNDREAADVRNALRRKGIFLVNLMASPGAGKTTLLVRTIRALKDHYRIGVIEADVDSDVDAHAVSEAGAHAIQIHTGGSCHMDADMTRKGLEDFDADEPDLIFLENIGNLVCPAEFDLGETLKVMILSVPEGDDKPLKYPLMFQVSDCLLISKIDVRPVFDFDSKVCEQNVRKLNPDIHYQEISAKTGEGFEAWISYLTEKIEDYRTACHSEI